MGIRDIKAMRNKAAHAYIVVRLGELAPAWTTWSTWMRPTGRARHAALIKARCVPSPVRVPGVRGHLFRAEDLDRFVERTIELAHRGAA